MSRTNSGTSPRARGGSPAMRIYLSQLDVGKLTAQEEREYAVLVSEGDIEARDEMIQANLPLVVGIAKNYRNRGLDFEDLVEEGNLGLFRAVEEFDPSQNIRFSTYARYWISQALKAALREHGRLLRLSSHASGIVGRWRRAEEVLGARTGRTPTADEVAAHLKLTPKQRALAVQAVRASLARPEGFEEDVQDRQPRDPAQIVQQKDELAALLRHLNKLNAREATVIRLRFGLPPYYAEHSTEEISRRLRICHMTVERIEGTALWRLRELCS